MQFETLLMAVQSVSGSSFVGIDTLTDVKLPGGKKNPLQGRVTKAVTGSQVMVFQNKNVNGYEAMVQRRLIAEGKDPNSFQLKERSWGQRLPNLPIVVHDKGGQVNYYLEVIFLRAGKVQYMIDGRPCTAEQAGIETAPAADTSGQGGLENQVIIRTFAAESITEIRIDQHCYR